MSDSKLLPCPFCGGKPKRKSCRAGEDMEEAWVECTECDARGPYNEEAYADHGTAAMNWNKRVPAQGEIARETLERLIERHVGAWLKEQRNIFPSSFPVGAKQDVRALADAVLALSPPQAQGRRPLGVGRVVQIEDFIKELRSVADRWGNTCVYIRPNGCTWGAVALNAKADDEAASPPHPASASRGKVEEKKEVSGSRL